MGWRPLVLQKLDAHTLNQHEKANTKTIAKDLDMADELHEAAAMRITSYQQRAASSYNRHVKQRTFQAGDLVLRKVFENMADPITGKFKLNWEGPYAIVKIGATKSYALHKLDGTLVPCMWNDMHLMRYY